MKCQNLFSQPLIHCFGVNKTDRSDVFNCLSSSASSSRAKVLTIATNNYKASLFIPNRDSIKQSVKKTRTSLVRGKFKVGQWTIKTKGTKFSNTNKCIKIRFGSLLERVLTCGKNSKKRRRVYT